MTVLLVAIGGAVGAALRYLAGHLLDRRLHWGTLTVNLVGSFLLGGLVSLGGADYALLGVGFCGALTTYSSFVVQAVNAGQRRATAYVVVTVGGCLLAATLGHLVLGPLT